MQMKNTENAWKYIVLNNVFLSITDKPHQSLILEAVVDWSYEQPEWPQVFKPTKLAIKLTD